jgi:probable HAF family extracellular repeat protein
MEDSEPLWVARGSFPLSMVFFSPSCCFPELYANPDIDSVAFYNSYGAFSSLNELNNSGQVAGFSDLVGDLTSHPIIGDRRGMKDPGTFGGDNGNAAWLNDAGQAVGTADFPGNAMHHAFIWQNGVKTDLGTVDGDGCTNGVGINSLGQAVGTSTDCQGNVLHLFLWEDGSMLNLSGLILPGSDVVFNDPEFINDRGEIVGNGILPSGNQHAILIVPPAMGITQASTAATTALWTQPPRVKFVGRKPHSLQVWQTKTATGPWARGTGWMAD